MSSWDQDLCTGLIVMVSQQTKAVSWATGRWSRERGKKEKKGGNVGCDGVWIADSGG